MTAPIVFISYSHDTPEHKQWVLRLATDLRTNGVDATLDQWDLVPGQDIAAFMAHGIAQSDRVLLICSDNYVTKAEQGTGGVGYERLIVTAELVQNIDTKKFIPLIRNSTRPRMPNFLGPRLYLDFSNDSDYQQRFDDLLREILGAPSSSKPPLGPSPFSGVAPTSPSTSRSAGPTGRTASGGALLDESWFIENASVATEGAQRGKIKGYMEVRLAPHDPVAKSQIELLNAVRESEIHTFGWPIGITLENRPEYRPRPVHDGIRADIAISDKGYSGSPSYDYWALRNTGDFYLLQSLFEDQRGENQLFFNTRIVRVSEALMFAANLYENLGAPPETRISARITHSGLAGRILTASSANRHVMPAVTSENVSQTELTLVLGEIKANLVTEVQRVTAPLFMLFDFKTFNDQIYTDIVSRFVDGEVT